MIKTVLLDLDGTIVNSEPGITACVSYALSAVGIAETDKDMLRRFIGPPLRYSLAEYYHLSGEQIDRAIAKYRERYEPVGIFESELYAGVEPFLRFLKEHGFCVALASSKPEDMCRKLLAHFGLDGYFDEVVGATRDGRIDSKIQVLEETFRRLPEAKREETVLVGDTRFDAFGGKSAGIAVIGITYGFGTREELEEAGVVVFDTLGETADYLMECNNDAESSV